MEAPGAGQPPTPPSLPPQRHHSGLKGFALKYASAPPDWAAQYLEAISKSKIEPVQDPFQPPSGWYFLYGTLRDPTMLAEILELSEIPVLRPAHVVGYLTRRWGQYPALVDGPCGSIVRDSAFHVADEASATKLASYETNNYHSDPCYIHFDDVTETNKISGRTFRFCGNTRDLSDGDFDLNTWLKQMGRQTMAGGE